MNDLTPDSAARDDERADKLEAAIRRLSREASKLGVDLAEISGAIQDVAENAREQNDIFVEVARSAKAIDAANSRSAKVIAVAKDDAVVARERLGETSSTLSASRERIGELQTASGWMKTEIEEFNNALRDVKNFAKIVSGIARQTSLLAINAAVEAARAGEVGRGFAVVASEVQTLAQQASAATENVQLTLGRISDRTESLVSAGVKTVDASANAIELSEKMSTNFSSMETIFGKILDGTDEVAGNITTATEEFGRFRPQLASACKSVDSTTRRLSDAARNVETVVRASEKIIQTSAETGVEVPDSKWVVMAQDNAFAVATLFERAIAERRLSVEDVFDLDYQVIPGSDPEQVMTRYTLFTDEMIRPLLEAITDREPNVVFCAAADQNGYLPTHNWKFSHPQRPGEPVWNAANCRNRRILNDRTGLGVGRNRAPFLIQTYRRDMGGGNFAMMKDISAPITVNGRHWGGFRIAVKD